MLDHSDRSLVSMALQAEQQAFGELVRRYQTSVFNVCYRIMGERQEAEDMTQETFLRAHDRLNTYDPERPFGPWIRRVGANFCLNTTEHYKKTLVSKLLTLLAQVMCLTTLLFM